jgi:purine-binding chemotaxis protein CheW
MAKQQFSTFWLGGHLFGIEVARVQEVLRYQRLTAVPLAPPEITGLINLRGHIVAALDLGRRLGLPDRPDGQLPLIVVVRTGEDLLALLVDGIGDVTEVGDDLFEPAPDTLSGSAHALVPGAYKLEDRLLLLLDADAAGAVIAA